MKKKVKTARLADQPTDYMRLNLVPGRVLLREDGIRTSFKKGEFEWWYFDSKMDDGSSLVIVFFTTDVLSQASGFHPCVTFGLTRPDGSVLEDRVEADVSECSFGEDHCCVKIGESCFEGNLDKYTITFRGEAVCADVSLNSNVNPWKPATGHILFGKKDYFAWLPSVPEGLALAEVRSAGNTENFSGTGYHDHNWGNTMMPNMMHHWYWGRAKIGDYQVISSYITAREKYGFEEFPIFMLAKGRELIGDDTSCLTFSQLDPEFDVGTGKHYHKTVIYDYNKDNLHYKITYSVEDIIDRSGTDAANGPLMSVALKIMRLEPAYLRFTGTAMLQRFSGDEVTESISSPAIWELMYFGKDLGENIIPRE